MTCFEPIPDDDEPVREWRSPEQLDFLEVCEEIRRQAKRPRRLGRPPKPEPPGPNAFADLVRERRQVGWIHKAYLKRPDGRTSSRCPLCGLSGFATVCPRCRLRRADEVLGGG